MKFLMCLICMLVAATPVLAYDFESTEDGVLLKGRIQRSGWKKVVMDIEYDMRETTYEIQRVRLLSPKGIRIAPQSSETTVIKPEWHEEPAGPHTRLIKPKTRPIEMHLVFEGYDDQSPWRVIFALKNRRNRVVRILVEFDLTQAPLLSNYLELGGVKMGAHNPVASIAPLKPDKAYQGSDLLLAEPNLKPARQ